MPAPLEPPFAPLEAAAPFANPLRKERRRVLMVLPWLALGGADRFNLETVRALTARGFEITIVTTQAGDHRWESAFAEVTPDQFALARLMTLRDRPRFLRHLIESRRPDFVVISNSELGYLLLPWLRARCPDPAYIDFCHMEQEEWKSGGYPRLSLLAAASLDATFVSSRHLRDWMLARGGEPERIAVVHTGIDATRWKRDPAARERLRRAWGIGDEEAVLLFAGRLCAQKQPNVLLRTVAILARRGIAVRAVIAGDGPLYAAVEREAACVPAPVRIDLLGAVDPRAMVELLSASDLFFLPSRMEGIALSLFEAMAMELPVVAGDVGGQRELVGTESGILIATLGDPEREAIAYADALEPLLRDAVRRRALGSAGRERVMKCFDAGATFDAMLAGFETARTRRRATTAPIEIADAVAAQAVEFLRMQDETGRLADMEAAHAQFAERLARLDGSRALRWLRRAKQTAPYRIWARWRWGADWERTAP
jgi:glycosyltransferase involved in cell wall biosynthesis